MVSTSANILAADIDRSLEGDSEAARDLLARLISDDPEAQTQTADMLEDTHGPEVWRLLLEVLAVHTWRGDPTPVVEAAGQDPKRLAFSIRGLFCNLAETPAQPTKVAVLEEALDHPDPNIRLHAALLLGRRGDVAALPYLVDMLISGDEVWAVPAANVLGEQGYSQAADALVGAIAEDLPCLHRAAAQALKELGSPAVPALIRALQHPDNHVRWHAARVLGKIGTPEAIPALIQAQEDVDNGVRWLAGEALIHIGDEILEPLFENLAHNPINAFRRTSTIHVLRRFESEGLREVTPVIDALRTVDYATLTPMAAYEVLQKLRRISRSRSRTARAA